MNGLSKREVVHEAISWLQRLTELFQRRRYQLASAAGITEQQWLVLEKISQEHFIPSLFAKERDSSAAAVSKIIRQLVDKALVDVTLSREDARLREYALTPGGEALMKRLRDLREQAIDEIWMTLDSAALQQFCRFGSDLTEAILRFERKEA
jgi:DNA-binding MarR family transcriptional regulator